MKRCKDCKKEKPIEDFHKGADRCKRCACQRYHEYYERNKFRINEERYKKRTDARNATVQ